MPRTIAAPLSGASLLGGLLVVAVLVLSLLVWSDLAKGVWYDEMWSKWMSSRELGLADAVRDRWLQDVHPPLFYIFNWSISAAIGPDVVVHRFLNFVWLAALAGLGAYLAHIRASMRPALVVGAILLLSNRDLGLFVEYRSYAMIMCATAALMLLLAELMARGRDLVLPEDGVLLALLGLVIALSLNLHYISTAICGITIAVFSFDRARLGQWRWAGAMMAVAVVAMLPLLAGLWAQQPYVASAVQDFWIRTRPIIAVKIVAGKLVYATGLNLVLAWCAVMLLRNRNVDRAAAHFAVLAIGSALIACSLLLLINLFKPVIVTRYLAAISPIVIFALAALLGPRIASDRKLFLVFVANAAVVGLIMIWPIRKADAWNDGAQIVATMVRECPDTNVYAMSRMVAVPKPTISALPNDGPFMEWAMTDLARSYGFTPAMVHPTVPVAALPLSTGGCPTVLWLEHFAKFDGPATAAVAGLAAGTLKTIHTPTGTIIIRQAD